MIPMINLAGLQRRLDEITKAYDLASTEFDACVQAIADTYRVHIATGHMSDNFAVSRDGEDWDHEFSGEFPEVFAELNRLEVKVEDFGIGPGNLRRWTPSK